MTCVAAVVHQGHVYLGADSIGFNTGTYAKARRLDPKVFRRTVRKRDLDQTEVPIVLGFTSSFRMGQLLRYRVELPAMSPIKDPFEYLVTDLVEAVRHAFTEGGFGKTDEDGETGGDFFVGMEGRLFTVLKDFQVEEVGDSYAAIGCGGEVALGSLFMSQFEEPSLRLRWALHAACHHSAGVAGPFRFVSTLPEFEVAL